MKAMTPATELVAATTERLAVLLTAGIPPATAWRHLATPASGKGPPLAPVAAAATAASHGDELSDAIQSAAAGDDDEVRDAWAALAAAWRVAEVSGAPPARSLRALASSFRALGRIQRQMSVALAAPAATARMVMAMPVVAVLFGFLLGFNTVGTLLTTAPGLLCLGAAAALMLVGARWNRRMIRRATPTDRSPGLALDLLAVAMSGGVSVQRARSLVRESLPQRLTASHAELVAADDVLELAQRAGIPAAELLRSEAEARRTEAGQQAEQRAVTLSVRLMIPLGLCVLPAFMLVGVVPLLLAIVSSTVTGLG